jgi:septal ring-binding cell division protein DamX
MISPAKPKPDTRATGGIKTSSEFTRKIPLPLIGGNYYLQAAAFSRRASADRWIRNQKSSEKYKVAKKSNGFWVVLTGPFSEPVAARQQSLKAKQNQRPLVLNSNELDPMWIF